MGFPRERFFGALTRRRLWKDTLTTRKDLVPYSYKRIAQEIRCMPFGASRKSMRSQRYL